MGLDIRAVNGLVKCDIQSEDAYNKYSNVINIIPQDILFNQSSGLDGYYTYQNNEYTSFRVGAYSSYVKWRRMLAKMIGYPDIEELWKSIERDGKIGSIINEETYNEIPFIELLYFSDSEGFIGTKVSKKLYKDFIENKSKAHVFSLTEKNKDWLTTYNDFTEAFKVASNNGVVQFC